MKIWLVDYCRCPTNFNSPRTARVEAETARDAEKLLKEQLNKGFVFPEYDVPFHRGQPTREYNPNPNPPAGKVLEL